jgi:hypothetical protein
MMIARVVATVLFLTAASPAWAQSEGAPAGLGDDRMVRIRSASGIGQSVPLGGAIQCTGVSRGLAGWKWERDGEPEVIVPDLSAAGLLSLVPVLAAAGAADAPRGDALVAFAREKGVRAWSRHAGGADDPRVRDGLVELLKGSQALGCGFATRVAAQELAAQIKAGKTSAKELADRLPSSGLVDVETEYGALYQQTLPGS